MVFGNPRQCGFCKNYYWQEEAHAKRCHRMKQKLERKAKESKVILTKEQEECIKKGHENFKRFMT